MNKSDNGAFPGSGNSRDMDFIFEEDKETFQSESEIVIELSLVFESHMKSQSASSTNWFLFTNPQQD